MSQPAQLFSTEEIWQRSLLAKIRGLIPWQVEEHLERCGREELYRTCRECGRIHTFYYRCSLKFCPQCNWRIARQRAQLLRLWTLKVKQPKHVVVTTRNAKFITRSTIRKFQKALCKLRRKKVFKPVTGGCVSMEITNEGRGWHIHGHILADAKWIDAGALAVEWGKLVGQDYAIVKVKDARGKDYLNEVTKYVVKGSQLASWEPNEIAEFINAIRGIRFFSTFGTLFNFRQQVKQELEFLKPAPAACECGSKNFVFETEEMAIVGELRRLKKR